LKTENNKKLPIMLQSTVHGAVGAGLKKKSWKRK